MNTTESSNVLTFGMSAPFTGPSQFLGIEMRAGIQAAFDAFNRNGGIKGKKLRLISLDDGYEPARVPDNMLKLIEAEKVLGFIGNVGTPTAISALPITLEHKILFFAPLTGAGVLRKTSPDRYVINYRASYAEETRQMIAGLLDTLKIKPQQVAFLTQRDGFGDAGYAGAKKALEERGINIGELLHTRYERNSLSVENAVADLLLADPTPKAVIIVGTYDPVSKFIRLAKQNGLDALFLNVSFVESSALASKLGEQAEGVIVTQVVPHYNSDLAIVKEYRTDLNQLDPDLKPSFVGIEGYISARILGSALERSTGEITRESIVSALEGLGEFDIGLGVPLKLEPLQHQASNKIWPTIYRQGEWTPFEWHEIAAAWRQEL